MIHVGTGTGLYIRATSRPFNLPVIHFGRNADEKIEISLRDLKEMKSLICELLDKMEMAP